MILHTYKHDHFLGNTNSCRKVITFMEDENITCASKVS